MLNNYEVLHFPIDPEEIGFTLLAADVYAGYSQTKAGTTFILYDDRSGKVWEFYNTSDRDDEDLVYHIHNDDVSEFYEFLENSGIEYKEDVDFISIKSWDE